MLELTEQEIDRISSEIDQQGLTYTQLKNEILDHICCNIEAEMEQGLTFNEAYRKVKSEMGKKRIRQIQDETLYLISKKYRRMKRLMFVLGVAVPIIIIIASIFKVMHWPGASILITLSLFVTGAVFLPVFVMVRIRDTRKQDEPVPMGLYLTGMIAGILTVIGALMKIQHLPGAGIFLTLGLVGLAFVFLPIFAVVRMREARKKNEPLNTGMYISGVVAGILFILGALFKVQHWPGAGAVILVSWFSVAVLLLPFFVLNQLKQKENRINNFFGIIVVVSMVAILIMALTRPTSTSKDVLDTFIQMENNLLNQAGQLNTLSDNLLESSKQSVSEDVLSNMNAISSESDKICEFIQSVKKEMVIGANEENAAVVNSNDLIDFNKAYGKDNLYIVDKVMYGEEFEDGKCFAIEEMLKGYKSNVLALTKDEDLKTFIEEQLMVDQPGPEYGWGPHLTNGSMVRTAAALSMAQSTVRLIEYKLLQELSVQTESI
ncbi:MAG: hypothetical protein ISS19_02475 [Bacteroidales bacterium]|nr:hypothetical protein [Bacteroidales bacterium]